MLIITVCKLLKRANHVQVVFLFIQVTFISLCKHSTLATNFFSDINIQQFVYLVGLAYMCIQRDQFDIGRLIRSVIRAVT